MHDKITGAVWNSLKISEFFTIQIVLPESGNGVLSQFRPFDERVYCKIWICNLWISLITQILLKQFQLITKKKRKNEKKTHKFADGNNANLLLILTYFM